MGSLLRQLFSFSHIVFFISLVTLYSIQFEGFANDPGVGWHLVDGMQILKSLSVPHTDPFLSSPVARPWISDQWLSDVIFFWIYERGGWALLYNFGAVLFISTFFILIFPKVRGLSSSYISTAIATFCAFKIAEIHFILRPVIFSFPLFAAVYFAALNLYLKPQGRPPYFLLPIFILWANIHPSFSLGLLLVGLVPFAILIDQFLVRDSASLNWLNVKGLLSNPLRIFVLCLLGTFINPYGYDLHLSIFELGNSDYFMNLNEEWLSPNFDDVSGSIFLSMVGCVVIPFIIGCRQRWGIFQYATLVLFSVFSLKAVRFFPYFGIVAAPLVAQSLASLAQHRIFTAYSSFSLVQKGVDGLARKEKFYLPLVVVILLGLFVYGTINGTVPLFSGTIGPDPKRFPLVALEKLLEIDSSSKPVTVLASPGWGGAITLVGEGKFRPVIDDRNTLVGESFYKELIGSMRPGGNWKEYAARYSVDYMLISASSPLLCDIERSELEIVYSDEVASLIRM